MPYKDIEKRKEYAKAYRIKMGFRGWHIDHIKPCASFDLTDPKQQQQCFHYSNLQPLWWYDNLSKGDKY